VEEYDLVAQLAVSNGENYEPKLFPRETLPPGFVFSLPEIVRLVAHRRRLAEARNLGPLVRKLPKLAAQGQNWRRKAKKVAGNGKNGHQRCMTNDPHTRTMPALVTQRSLSEQLSIRALG
jgi:hypothetical protein